MIRKLTEYTIRNFIIEELKSRLRTSLPYMEGIIAQSYEVSNKGVDLLPLTMDINEIPSFSNPISILLSEGITKSFPLQVTMRYVKRHFGDIIKDIRRGTNFIDGESNNNILICIKTESNLIDKISRVMALCGYYLAVPFSRIPMGKSVWLQYEPKYDKSLSDEIRNTEKYLLHLTPEVYISKIKKNGLVPRSKNQYSTYPERVYLLRGSTPPSEIDEMYRMLSTVYNMKRNNPVWTYGVVYIDIARLPENLKLFTDPNYPIYGLYTTDNIPPDAIINIDRNNMQEN